MYQTRTEWFDGKTQVPGGKGVYEREYPAGIYFSYWNGEFWGQAAASEKHAHRWAHEYSIFQDIPFRGLKVKP